MSAFRSRTRNSPLVESVLNGSVTAPIRAAASVATTNELPFGCSRPMWLPLPNPAANKPLASSAERRSASCVCQGIVVADEQVVVTACRGTLGETCGDSQGRRRIRYSVHGAPQTISRARSSAMSVGRVADLAQDLVGVLTEQRGSGADRARSLGQAERCLDDRHRMGGARERNAPQVAHGLRRADRRGRPGATPTGAAGNFAASTAHHELRLRHRPRTTPA